MMQQSRSYKQGLTIVFFIALQVGLALDGFCQASIQPIGTLSASVEAGPPAASNGMPRMPDSPSLPANGFYQEAVPTGSSVSPFASDQFAPLATQQGSADASGSPINVGQNVTVADLPDLDALKNNSSEPIAQNTTSEASNRSWRFRPLAGLGYVYDDNVFITHTNTVSSSLYQITGGFSFEAGDYRQHKNDFLSLNYLGTGLIYPDLPQINGYDQTANLIAQHIFEKLSIILESFYQYLNGPNRDVGNYVRGTALNNTLKLIYKKSSKTSIEFALNQHSNIYPANFSTYYQEVRLGMDYQLHNRLKIGVQGILGENTTQGSPNQDYQTLNGKMEYSLTGKLLLKASAGLQANEYTTGNLPARFIPIFSLGCDYHPTSSTLISLIGYRNLQSSASLTGQDYLATGFSLSVDHSIHQRWTPGITIGYENDTYIPNASGVSTSRVDNYAYIRPHISYHFLKYLDADVYYSFKQNNSTYENYTWKDNQIGVACKTAF
jgi:hypothetical protein